MLDTKKLTLRVSRRTLVDSLDWNILPGQCWCVIGRNGAGKSTLLRALAGVRDADGGSVRIDGRALSDWSPLELAQRRAWLPQGRNDPFGYRAIDTVLMARHPYQGGRYWESEADLALAREALRRLDAGHLETRDVRTLSGGERQRVAIAATLAQQTPLLLLDEPAAALDLAHQVAAMDLFARLCREEGRAVVLVSHDLNLAHRAASHALLLMPDGGWRAGPVDEIMTPALLGACLGHPVEAFRHAGRMLFVPADGAPQGDDNDGRR
jgi:iron complex transport system ATP-binding protein